MGRGAFCKKKAYPNRPLPIAQVRKILLMIAPKKDKLTRYILIGLILGFFVIPLAAYCFFDCKFYVPKKVASVLILFFR
jgi:hypothetical protein